MPRRALMVLNCERLRRPLAIAALHPDNHFDDTHAETKEVGIK